jgi:hypothetical protein
VALFTYDNGAFLVENFRDDAAKVGIVRKGQAQTETVSIPPHSFRLFRASTQVSDSQSEAPSSPKLR